MLTLNGGGLTVTGATTIDNQIVLSGSGGNSILTAENVTLSNAVSGTGALAKGGVGTLTLTGTNTFNGASVNAGALSIADGTALGSGTVTLQGTRLLVTGTTSVGNQIVLSPASDATIEVSNGATATFTGIITGSGGANLVKTGSGTATLDGASSGANNTLIQQGTLSVDGDADLGVGQVVIAGGTLATTQAMLSENAILIGLGGGTIATAADTTLSGTVDGTTTLVKTGAATLTLSGTNTHSGDTTIAAGQLTVSGGSALSDTGTVTVEAGATLNLANSNETIGMLAGSGTVLLGSGTLTQTDQGASSFSGTLSGTSTYVIASGVTLKGTGTYTTPIAVQSGATIAPGNSPGIIGTGDLTLAGGSTATFEIDGTTAGSGYDQINVTGTVTISGATLDLDIGYSSVEGDSYVLINNDGTDAVTGTFDGLAEGATLTLSGRTYQISYAGGTGNDVTLTDFIPASGGGDGGGGGGPTGASDITGTAGAERLVGAVANDTLRGDGGDDTLSGAAGTDILYGNQGGDLLYGNQGSDRLYGGQGTDTLYGGQNDDLLWGNRASDIVYGNNGADVLYGNEEDDRVFGGAASDTLYGGQGADTLVGGVGDDALWGNLGADVFSFGDGSGLDRIMDFTIGEDRLAVSANVNGLGIATAADLVARVSDDGTGNALLDLGGGHTVTLIGIAPTSVSADWFLVA